MYSLTGYRWTGWYPTTYTMSKADKILSCGVSQQLYDDIESVVEQNEELSKSQILREGLRRELQKYEVKDYE